VSEHVTGASAVTTVILVTPSRDASDPTWGFVTRHVEALGAVVDRVFVLTPDDASLLTEASSGPGSTRRAIDALLSSRDDETVVVVLDDTSLLAQVRAAIGERAPVLWWSSQVPTAKSIDVATRWADGMAVLSPPDGGTGDLPSWIVGAGVDVLSDPPAPPNRLPLQLLALGRTAPSKGLTTVIRAVAVARSTGIDTRLRVIGPATNAVEVQYRHALDTLVRDVALSSVVTIEEPIPPSEVGAAIAAAHALIDASVDDDLRRAPLEALASRRPVLTSNQRVARLVPNDVLVLDFAPGDAAQLAQRFGTLAESWPASAASVAEGVPTSLAVHERSSLVAQWRDAVESIHRATAPRRPPSVPAAMPSTPADSEPTEEVALPPAAAVTAFLDVWTDHDPERALASCAPGALRYGTSPDGTGGGAPIADYLFWAAQTADELVSTIEDVDVVDDRTVVTVRRDRWTIGGEQFVVVVRSLFELEDGLVTGWTETELRPAPSPTAAIPPAAAPIAAPVTAVAPAPAPAPTPAEMAPATLEEQLERAEEQIHHWRRQAVIWRERALEARSLGEAYKANVEDLRVLVELFKRQAALSPASSDRESSAGGAYADDDDPDAISWVPEEALGRPADAPPTPAPTATPAPPEPPEPPEPDDAGTAAVAVPAASQPRRAAPETLLERSLRMARELTRSFGKR
jgi:glycosyltransferase involved in cell wall biosynthesis